MSILSSTNAGRSSITYDVPGIHTVLESKLKFYCEAVKREVTKKDFSVKFTIEIYKKNSTDCDLEFTVDIPYNSVNAALQSEYIWDYIYKTIGGVKKVLHDQIKAQIEEGEEVIQFHLMDDYNPDPIYGPTFFGTRMDKISRKGYDLV